MNTRLRKILKWCDERSISQVFSFFRGCDPSLEADVLRIYAVLRKPESVTDIDEPWIESMEATINALNSRK